MFGKKTRFRKENQCFGRKPVLRWKGSEGFRIENQRLGTKPAFQQRPMSPKHDATNLDSLTTVIIRQKTGFQKEYQSKDSKPVLRLKISGSRTENQDLDRKPSFYDYPMSPQHEVENLVVVNDSDDMDALPWERVTQP